MSTQSKYLLVLLDLVLKFDEVILGKFILRYSDFANPKALRYRQMNLTWKWFIDPIQNNLRDKVEDYCLDYKCNCRFALVRGK